MNTLYKESIWFNLDIAGISFRISSMLDKHADLRTDMVVIMKLYTLSESRHMIQDNLPGDHMLS
jgi:hypothetical protein